MTSLTAPPPPPPPIPPQPHVSPSTSSRNPFARPKPPHASSSFTRATLLPSLISPAKQPTSGGAFDNPLATPADKAIKVNGHGTGTGGRAARQGWRLLWRGGVEIGPQGWRLDGVTFFASLQFPATPSTHPTPTANPFDVPIVTTTTSPFGAALPAGDTDLCLSLESMRGRKYLQIRGVVDLPENEVLEGEGEEGGVQMSIAANAPLLAGYFTSFLCRNQQLSASGRTLSAIVIGLGDESVDPVNSTVLVYGQRSMSAASNSLALKLHVARRKPPPPAVKEEKKVRPGEPLPRAPLFFPAKNPKRPPPPIPRSFSRAPSTSSIYAPPPTAPPPIPAPIAPVSGRTPGRRGEKRHRSANTAGSGEDADEAQRKRKAGRIIVSSRPSADLHAAEESKGDALDLPEGGDTPGVAETSADDEDIFGKRPSAPPLRKAVDFQALSEGAAGNDTDDAGTGRATTAGEPPSTGRAKRVRVPQQVLDNKATIRKQTLLLLAERGYPREHDIFKDVFGMTTKGCYFAFRDRLEDGPLGKDEIRHVVTLHLGMYLPLRPRTPPDDNDDDLDMADEPLVKVEEKASLVPAISHGISAEIRVKVETVQERVAPVVKGEPSQVKAGSALASKHERVDVKQLVKAEEEEEEALWF